MAQDWNDQRRGWDDNRSYGAQRDSDAYGTQDRSRSPSARDGDAFRQGRAGDFPSQYSGMGGSSTRNVDAHRLHDADHGDMDRFDHSRGRWNAPGTGGVGHERGAPEARGSMGGYGVRRDDRAAFGGQGGQSRDQGGDFGRGSMAGYGGQLSSYGERYQDGTGPQLGGHSGQGLQHGGGPVEQQGRHGHDHVYEENYHNWRAEQMRRFDQEYHEFRQHRQERFNSEFEEWRKSRGGAGSASASHSGSQSGGTGEQTILGGHTSTTQRPAGDNKG